MKTIKEWFDEQPWGGKAIANTDEDILETCEPSIKKALISSFIWSSTLQGFEYWNNIYEQLNATTP